MVTTARPSGAPATPAAASTTTVRRPTAAAAERVGSSTVRDLLALTARPDVISLAGGLPDPASFPIRAIASATARLLDDDGPASLQYAPTEGDARLRDWIVERRGTRGGAEDVVVTHGSQQALDLIVRATVMPGDPVVVADPAYVGALQILRLADADVVGIPSDGRGLDVGDLERRLRLGLRPRLVYTVSTFHNPSGATLDDERRRALAALADRYGFLIVEDDPYGELRWRGPRPAALAELTDRVLTLGSFSKTLSPGLRVGYAIGATAMVADLVILKQATDLQTSTFNQALVREVVTRSGWYDTHVTGLCRIYEERADSLGRALRDRLGERLTFSPADGGMFLWVTATDPGLDSRVLLDAAIERGVAFVPGPAFAVDDDLRSSMRLSFATATPDELRSAVDRLTLALADITT